MEDELIKFETAKLAKEKGFDLESSGVYDEKCVLGINHHDYRRLYKNSLEDNWNTAAPTQSLLQRWLREVHNIHLTVIHRLDISNYKEYYDYLLEKTEVKYRHYTSWEEALEIGLYQALLLIKST